MHVGGATSSRKTDDLYSSGVDVRIIDVSDDKSLTLLTKNDEDRFLLYDNNIIVCCASYD